MSRYAISEWFGERFSGMSPDRRQELASTALGHGHPPNCPFQRSHVKCRKKGGVCSIRSGANLPVATCPRRFEEGDIISRWLADIAGFNSVFLAREVPFMISPATGRSAGRIDMVLSTDSNGSQWFGLEIQAVYFSGKGMQADFEKLLVSNDREPPEPTALRRPDWRSSSAKRLMPQLQVKAPTLRRWGKKLAVAVDLPFFEAIGGPSNSPSHDLNDGDIIWLVPQINDTGQMEQVHWEVLSLEDSSAKLLSAETIRREEFEDTLRDKLMRIR